VIHASAFSYRSSYARWACCAAVLLTFGCVSAPSGGSSAASNAAAAPRTSRDVILADEIVTSGARTALEAIKRLRPQMLQGRGVRETQEIAIYVDGTRTEGTRADLEQIPASQVKEIRYLNGQDATQRFGANHGAGAILVTRKS
jgi:hypothetical protein